MLKKIKWVTIIATGLRILSVLASFALTGCLATLEYTPEQVRLCEVEEPNEWGGGELKIADVAYFFRLSDSGSADDITGPIPDVFWVSVYGSTAGRAVGGRAPAMIYDPAEAIINIRGEKIKALPRAWRSDQISGYFIPTTEISVPFNLNTSINPPTFGFYIAFPIRAPRAKDEYVISPGTVLLDGERRLLPAMRSCYTPGKFWWYPIT